MILLDKKSKKNYNKYTKDNYMAVKKRRKTKTRLNRINTKKKKKDKLREKVQYIHWYSSGRFHTPHKLKSYQELELDKARQRDYENNIDLFSPFSEWQRLMKEFYRYKIEHGYYVEKSRSNCAKKMKKISRKTLRAKSKQELLKDPDEISLTTGSTEDKYFDYAWNID